MLLCLLQHLMDKRFDRLGAVIRPPSSKSVVQIIMTKSNREAGLTQGFIMITFQVIVLKRDTFIYFKRFFQAKLKKNAKQKKGKQSKKTFQRRRKLKTTQRKVENKLLQWFKRKRSMKRVTMVGYLQARVSLHNILISSRLLLWHLGIEFKTWLVSFHILGRFIIMQGSGQPSLTILLPILE